MVFLSVVPSMSSGGSRDPENCCCIIAEEEASTPVEGTDSRQFSVNISKSSNYFTNR